jgi:membrane protein implicated in regulation of membrane protease activity
MFRKFFYFFPWLWGNLTDDAKTILVLGVWLLIILSLVLTGHYLIALYSFIVPVAILFLLILFALTVEQWQKYSSQYQSPQEKVVDRLRGKF